jgi:hypothetical protein
MEMQLFLRETLRQDEFHHKSGDDWHRMKLVEELKNEGKEEVVCDVARNLSYWVPLSNAASAHYSLIYHASPGMIPGIQPLVFISVVGMMS